MSNHLTLLSFYLGMVTLLSATFFVRLDGWYAEILSVTTQWNREARKKGKPVPDADQLKEYRLRVLALQAAWPIRGFTLVSIFIGILSAFSVALGYSIDPATAEFDFVLYVYVPGALFLALFFGGALYFLYNGYKCQLPQLLNDIDSV